MKKVITSILLFLMTFPAIAAMQEATAAEGAVEPLGTVYVVIIGLIFVSILVVFYLYYMRWDSDEDKPGQK